MRIVILGDGGHSRVIQEMIVSNGMDDIVAVLDDKHTSGFQKNDVIYAPMSFLFSLLRKDTKVIVAIGDNKTRQTIVNKLDLPVELYYTVIHHSAIVSTSATIGNGTVVMPYAVINANVQVEAHCIVNTRATIEHDNMIEAFTHVSPSATLTGGVTVGEGVHVGSSATIIPGKHLGKWSIIGAGSTVIEHIPAYSKAVGSPTRIIERMLMK